MQPITILTYHSLDTSGSVVSVPPAVFGEHMACIAGLGYRGVSLGEALAHRERTGAWPADSVILTFDDGYANCHESALTTLQRHGFSATVFLVSRHIGGRNDWAPPPRGLGTRPMLSWQQVAELSSCGMEIGAHTRTHPDLSHRSARQIDDEMAGARADLEDRLAVPVDTFAYPFGTVGPLALAAAARHFRAACTTRLKRAAAEPLHQLPRVDAYYIARNGLREAITGRLDGYLALRRCGRAIRTVLAAPQPATVLEHPDSRAS